MNKQQWKAEYSAFRALYRAAVRMDKYEETPQRNAAFKIVWDSAKARGKCFYYALINRRNHVCYPISANKWAVKHNTRGY